ncbi:MAG TPA: hypothetical protein ENN21_08005 [Spirochaetes bacterium]|nr:hypothetical protein [Spirochaetota bacterium]
MVKRNRRLSFIPGAYVFPGGAIDDADTDPAFGKHLPESVREQAWKTLPDMPDSGRALGAWVAAVRETFEEVGILLARSFDGGPLELSSQDTATRYDAHRARLLNKETTFLDIVREENLLLSADELVYFSHWVTPAISPIRYDVRFFIAPAPEGQKPRCDGSELTEQCWVTPDEAMDGFHNGRFEMVLPTLITMEELANFHSVGEAVRAAREKNIETILTSIKNISGRITETMPDGRTVENLPPLFRR